MALRRSTFHHVLCCKSHLCNNQMSCRFQSASPPTTPRMSLALRRALKVHSSPPNTFGLKASVSESLTLTMKPWKFEQSVHGNTTTLNWFLHDGVNGREVYSSKPSKLSLLQPRAWFRDRYSTVYRHSRRRVVSFSHVMNMETASGGRSVVQH
ncbi:hypothetical protein DAI22_01g234966 [Oryza sativa Japonica Group]|nr:hypothetical protein DAI22_01g234966 [Oryza sativa Japonica Group]